MKKTNLVAAMAAFVACASAHAQTKPVQAWTPPAQQELDPAKRVPATTPPATTGAQAEQQPARVEQAQSTQPYDSRTAHGDREGLGGFFVGVQGGKGWVYEDVDQKALMLNAGYRWQAGPVSLIGIEVASGRLDDAEHDGWRYDRVDFGSIGANARFNFGVGNPVYGVVRAGYWAADSSINDGDFRADVDGGYFGLGLGVDFNRHVNMSLIYTNYVYFNDYYWDDGEFYYDANRADTLMLGIEARF